MDEQLYLIETMTTDLALLVVDDMKVSVADALAIVYNSDTYTKMCNPETHLMYQSPNYVYSFLKNEVLCGKMA